MESEILVASPCGHVPAEHELGEAWSAMAATTGATECRWEREPDGFPRFGRQPTATPGCAPHFAPCVERTHCRRRVAWMTVTGHIPVNICGFDKAAGTSSGGRRGTIGRTCKSTCMPRSWVRSAMLLPCRPTISCMFQVTLPTRCTPSWPRSSLPRASATTAGRSSSPIISGGGAGARLRRRVIDWFKGMENAEHRRAAQQELRPCDTAWIWRELGIDAHR